MDSFDARLLRVGVEVKDQLRWYEGLQINASITKTATATQNEATVKITNIAKEFRDYILTETTPFNTNRVRKRIIIEAGRASYGYHRLFTGDITEAEASQPPDIAVTLKAKASQWDKGNIVSKSTAAQTRMSVLAASIAADMGLSLVFEATDKNISNYYFVGSAIKQVEKLAEMGQVNAYVDDDSLVVKDRGAALAQRTHILSMESGMIGTPQGSEQGVKVAYLFEPSSRLGGQLTLRSMLNPGLDGDYIIYKLNYELSNRDEPFYVSAEATLKGRGMPAGKKTKAKR